MKNIIALVLLCGFMGTAQAATCTTDTDCETKASRHIASLEKKIVKLEGSVTKAKTKLQVKETKLKAMKDELTTLKDTTKQ